MAVPFFLAFFVLSFLMFIQPVPTEEANNIKGRCPNPFDCNKFGTIDFPLSSSTENSQCGLCTVTCDEYPPKIHLGNEWPSYEVQNISQSGKITRVQIHDQTLQHQLQSKSCDAFRHYLRFPNSTSISFTISPTLTLFKCNKISPIIPPTDDHFNGFLNHTDCDDFNIYYKYPDNDQHAAPNCSMIQLPISLNHDPNDLFGLLSATFSVELDVSDDCWDCHLGGVQCPNDNQTFHCKAKKGETNLGLILGIAVPGIGIMAILLFCIIIWKLGQCESRFFWKNKTENYGNIEAFLKNCGSLSPKRYTHSDIKKMTNSFRVKLGQGGYGCVYRGLENGSLVAVKVLKGLKGSGEDFINEVASISRTSHVNVVTLLGFCFEGRHRALVYKFMPNGSLDKFIYNGNSTKHRQLGWETLYQITIGIARGLEYLHRGCNTRILHFDIKPHNILLDENFCPKISDFGLAKLCPQKESIISLTGARGTAGYIAPEVFCQNFGGVSHKADVYSYGMMVLEMIGGRKNIDVEVDHTSEIYFPYWIYKRLELDKELGLQGIMNDEANKSARKLVIVGLWCIQTVSSHRPSMSRVVEMLEGTLELLQIPPKPFLSSPSRSPAADSSTTLVP